MWSRYGVQELVGNRGSLFSALAMNETANFTSNIDHKGIDISIALRGVFRESELEYKLMFVRLYASTPRSSIRKVSVHPVSGCLVNCGACHSRHMKNMWSRADTYLMSDICLKFRPTVRARIEQVALIEIDSVMDSESTFDEEVLVNLLRSKALLVPFTDVASDAGAMSIVQDVAKHMVAKLRSLFEKHTGKGGYEQT